MSLRFILRICALALLTSPAAHAITVRISEQALERTLEKQLFKTADNRYYIRGRADTGCFAYADNPKVSFRAERIVVHVHTHARLGSSVHGACLGIGLNAEADVTLLPEAEGESIGFRDPRIENLSESRELNVFLEPFLSHKLPAEMKVNAADLLRQLLAGSKDSTGYDLKLDRLKVHSMQVDGDALVVDLDGDLDVH